LAAKRAASRTQTGAEADIREMEEDEGAARRALDLLGSCRHDACEAALASLREDMPRMGLDRLAREPDDLYDGEKAATADSDGLRSFLEGEVPPGSSPARKELANRPLIREQAFGEALDPNETGLSSIRLK
jgi:hypothetical protein